MKPNTPLHLSQSPLLRVWPLLLLFFSSFIPHPSSFAADSPLVIPFQGQVTNQQSQAVTTGQYSIIFNLYDVAVGGQPLWTERHSKVGVVNGMVNVFLGSITSLAAADFSQTRYLGITVDVDDKPTTADPEMVPRQMIIPAFFAKNSQKMAGYDWSAIMRDGDNNPVNNPLTGFFNADRFAAGSINSSMLADGGIAIEDLSGDVVSSLTGTLQQGVPSMTAMEAISAFDAVAVTKDGGNNVRLIKASSALGSRSAFYGFARSAAAVNEPVTVLQFGPLSGFSAPALTGGSAYYLGSTNGSITPTLPVDNLLQVYVGYALSGDTLFVDSFGVTKRWSSSNYWGNSMDGSLTTTGDVSLASTLDGDVVVKQYSQLTIGAGHTMTVQNRCRGLVIYVDGNCTINGTLTMTARGANADPTLPDSIASTGIRLARRKSGSNETLAASDVGGAGAGGVGALWRTVEAQQGGISANGKVYTITRTGGALRTGPADVDGVVGNTAVNGTGGGGTGGHWTAGAGGRGGDGGAGTCYSGGSGGGGVHAAGGASAVGGSGGTTGGPGGQGMGTEGASGGAGNPGGLGTNGGVSNKGSDGTGGLVILLVKGNLTIGAGAVISANGTNGGSTGNAGGGGGSGGGRILMLHAGAFTNSGTNNIIAAGGAGGTAGNGKPGGAGAAGSFTIDQIDP